MLVSNHSISSANGAGPLTNSSLGGRSKGPLNNNSNLHLSLQYTATPIEELSVLVSAVPAEQLGIQNTSDLSSYQNNNSTYYNNSIPNNSMVGNSSIFNPYNMTSSSTNPAVINNNSIVLNNNSITHLPFGQSLFAQPPNAFLSNVANNSFTNTKSFDDVLLLKKQMEGNPLGSSPDPNFLGVRASCDAYRVHLLIGRGDPEDEDESDAAHKRQQVAQTRAKWTQFEQLVRFIASVCPKFVPPAVPEALLMGKSPSSRLPLERNASYSSDASQSAGALSHSTGSQGSGGEDRVVPPEERELRKNYMEKYLNEVLVRKEASCLREVQNFVGYSLFIHNEKHRYKEKLAEERRKTEENKRTTQRHKHQSEHSDSSVVEHKGRKKEKRTPSKGRKKTKSHSNNNSNNSKIGEERVERDEDSRGKGRDKHWRHTHTSSRREGSDKRKKEAVHAKQHRRHNRRSFKSSSDSDPHSTESFSTNPTSSSLSSSSSSSSSDGREEVSSRGSVSTKGSSVKQAGAVSSSHTARKGRKVPTHSEEKKGNSLFRNNEDQLRMVEECFRIMDRHRRGCVTVPEMQWFLMCGFPVSFSRLMRLVREWSFDSGPRQGWDPWTESVPVGVSDVLPLWVREWLETFSPLRRQFTFPQFLEFYEGLLVEGSTKTEAERTLPFEVWLDQYWILQYSWIYFSAAAVMNGVEWANFRSRLTALKEEFFRYIVQRHQSEYVRPPGSGSIRDLSGSPTDTHPVRLRSVPQWLLAELTAALMEAPSRVCGMLPLEVLSLLYVLSETGLRLTSLEEMFYWLLSGPFFQIASFTFEEMSSLLDSFSKAMPFSDLLRSLTQGASPSFPSSLFSQVLGLASRSAPTADPIILSEIDDKIIQHGWRVRGPRCVNCDRAQELIKQYDADLFRLNEEKCSLEAQLKEALSAQPERQNPVDPSPHPFYPNPSEDSPSGREDHTHTKDAPAPGGDSTSLREEGASLPTRRRKNTTTTSNVGWEENDGSLTHSFASSESNGPAYLTLMKDPETTSREAVVAPGALLYGLPPHLPNRPVSLLLDLYPCTSRSRARENIVLRDSHGHKLLSFDLDGPHLHVRGMKPIVQSPPSASTLSQGPSRNFLEPTPYIDKFQPLTTTEVNCTDAGPPRWEATATTLSLPPKSWHRLQCNFNWSQYSFTVSLSQIRRDHSRKGVQTTGPLFMERRETDGLYSVDIYPRDELLLCYCNMCLHYNEEKRFSNSSK